MQGAGGYLLYYANYTIMILLNCLYWNDYIIFLETVTSSLLGIF